MPNPLSAFGVRDIDYAMSVGMVMGEALDEGLVGMGLVAATALNRAQNPSTYLSRSAALGDVFAAPFSAETMVDATRAERSLSGKGRQFSPTFNSNISGASTAGHANFKAGLEAALKAAFDPEFSPALGIRQEGYLRAQKALEVAVKARDLGIDISLGVEHFSAPGFEKDAGVGRNRSRFGGHSVSPTGGWPAGVRAPTSKEFASRFAAAAALTGVDIPDDMVSDITAHVSRGDIMAAASIAQREAQDYLSQELEEDVMPGLNYSDLVQRTGLEAIDVPDVTGQLGIAPMGAHGFADNFGITPDDGVSSFAADPIGVVEFSGYLDPVGPSPIDGPTAFTGPSSLAPAGAFSNQALGPSQGFTSPDAASLLSGTALGSPLSFDTGWAPGFEGFNAPGLIDQASFDERFNGAIPERAIETGYPETDLGITSPGALGMGETFGVEADPWGGGRGFAAGVDSGPWDSTPDFSAPSLEARNAMDRMQGAVDGWNGGAWNSSDLNMDAIADRVNAELGPKAADQARARDQAAMAAYDRDMQKYERDLAAYNTASKNFSTTKAGFNAAAPVNTMPTAGALAFDLGMDWGPNSLLDQAIAKANPVQAKPQLQTRPQLAARPVAPTKPQMTAPKTGVPEGWSPGAGSDGWGGYMDGTGGLAGLGLNMDDMGSAYDSFMDNYSKGQSAIAAAPGAPAVDQPSAWSSITGPINSAISLVTGPINNAVNSVTTPVKDGLRGMGLGDSTGFAIGNRQADFLDAMSNPTIAASYSPGIFDGWTGGALKGAALGGLTGGITGAVFGGIFGAADPFGRVTDRLGNAFGGWLDGQGFDLGFGPMASWDNWDPSTYGFGEGFNSRGERSHTGRDESGNATVGDGSYGERSGTNSNNPQGIL
jgi:hypothetical protein